MQGKFTAQRRAEIEAMLDALIPGDREIIRADRDRYPSSPMDEIATYYHQIGYITWWEDHPEWSDAEVQFAVSAPAIVRELLTEIDQLRVYHAAAALRSTVLHEILLTIPGAPDADAIDREIATRESRVVTMAQNLARLTHDTP